MLFRRDYWSLNDADIEKLALKHGIGAGTSTQGYDRQYAILPVAVLCRSNLLPTMRPLGRS